MSYTGSKASTAIGPVFKHQNCHDRQLTWTPVAEVADISLSGRQMGSEDVTNFSSSATEFVARRS